MSISQGKIANVIVDTSKDVELGNFLYSGMINLKRCEHYAVFFQNTMDCPNAKPGLHPGLVCDAALRLARMCIEV
jgi:hypothetical protein